MSPLLLNLLIVAVFQELSVGTSALFSRKSFDRSPSHSRKSFKSTLSLSRQSSFSRSPSSPRKTLERSKSFLQKASSNIASGSKVVYGTLKELSECPMPSMRCPNEDVTFHLFNRHIRDSDGYQLKEYEPMSIVRAPFVKPGRVIITCHGFKSHYKSPPGPQLFDAYNKIGAPVNIISIDWKNLCRKPCYVQAARNVSLVGMCTAAFIETLLYYQKWFGIKDIHFVGFSLGAQVASQVAEYLSPGNKLAWITALDAALPLFDSFMKSKEQRLDKGDADFVDVYHTNAGYKGHLTSIGHVDFYANYGLTQPGCEPVKKIKKFLDSSCNHRRAVSYYAESIYTKTGFYAYSIANALTQVTGISKIIPALDRPPILAGAYVDHNLKGSYFFTTRSQHPFAKGQVFT